MVGSNNVDELSKTNELSVCFGSFTLRVLFKDGCWHEAVQFENKPYTFLKIEDDVTIDCLDKCIDAFKVFSGVSMSEEIYFGGRTIIFKQEVVDGRSIYSVLIQVSKEDAEGIYDICHVPIFDDQLLEIAKFFDKASTLFLNLNDIASHVRNARGKS